MEKLVKRAGTCTRILARVPFLVLSAISTSAAVVVGAWDSLVWLFRADWRTTNFEFSLMASAVALLCFCMGVVAEKIGLAFEYFSKEMPRWGISALLLGIFGMVSSWAWVALFALSSYGLVDISAESILDDGAFPLIGELAKVFELYIYAGFCCLVALVSLGLGALVTALSGRR